MTYYEKALKRVGMLRGHVEPNDDAIRERKQRSFDLDKARDAFWATLPQHYFETFEALSEIHGLMDPSLYLAEKDAMREDTNKLFVKLVNKMFEKGFTTPEKIAENIDSFLIGAVSINSYDYATLTKLMVQYGLYCKTIKNLGTEKHRELLLDGTSLRTFGCFGLTEIGHGSNVKGVELTAEYDPETEEFVLNSPTKTSAKFWIGNLAKTAQNGVMFAQLITKGENKGVHAFVLPIRDRRTHTPLPGIEIGDCGDKLSTQGVDNGWIIFDNYRVPKDALLDKFGSVDKEGNYHTDIQNDNVRFANSIASLSGGRVIICRLSSECAMIGLTIALRFACARKQFGPPGKPEVQLISYPIHQHRLITRFADSFFHYLGSNRMIEMWGKNLPNLLKEKNKQTKLCHALCSNLKCFIAWDTQDTLAECRKACGGLGYSYHSLFGILTGINDLNQTWEGDNHVLMMQCQQFLFKSLKWISQGEDVTETLEFLSMDQPEMEEYNCCVYDLKGLKELFKARACYLVHKASQMMMSDPSKMAENFNNFQQFVLRDMCQAYHDIYLFETGTAWLDTISDKPTRAVFEKLLLLHIQNKLIKNSVFFQPILGEEKIQKAKISILNLLKDLRKEILSLTDVMPFTNRALGALGNEDLQIYDRVLQHIKTSKGVTERPSWWKLAYTNSEKA